MKYLLPIILISLVCLYLLFLPTIFSVEPVSAEAASIRTRFELTCSSAITIDSSLLVTSSSSSSTDNSSSSSNSNSSSHLGENWRKIMSVLGEVGNVFVISKGTEEEFKNCNINSMLENIGFPKHKLLVCDTEKGKIAIIRQMIPRFVITIV